MRLIALVSFLFVTNTYAGEFLSNVDKTLGSVVDEISKRDAVTGAITLNTKKPEESYVDGLRLFLIVETEAAKQGIYPFSTEHPTYQRVKKIYDRVVAVSHFKDVKNLKFSVYDDDFFNAIAFGGGHLVIFRGMTDVYSDDEIAYIIGHEVAHNAASHSEEREAYFKSRRLFQRDNKEGFETTFTNVQEQEADRIGILYASLAGFDPNAGVTAYLKLVKNDSNQYAYFRSHPANEQRARNNQYTASLVQQYYSRGIQNKDFEALLVCNTVFCNRTSEEVEDGKGGGILKALELIAVSVANKKNAKDELEQQRIEIAKSAPRVNWRSGWQTFRGTVQRHGKTTGISFGLASNQGIFYYNFNGQVLEGRLVFNSQDKDGYWYRWRDAYGEGNLFLREHSDGSIRGKIYIDDGSQTGKELGNWIGFKG